MTATMMFKPLTNLEAELDRMAEWAYGVEGDVNTLVALARRLLAAARAGLEDRERLDWLEAHFAAEPVWNGVQSLPGRIDITEQPFTPRGGRLASGATLRAAIDAARDGGRP